MQSIDAAGTLFAGAIFTEEEIFLLSAIVIGLLIVAVLATAVVLRSAIRLLRTPTGERSSTDQGIVVLAVLLLASISIGPIGTGIGSYRTQRSAVALISETSAIPGDEFEKGRWWNTVDCKLWVMPLRGNPSTFLDLAQAEENDQVVRSEALAFEAAGWDVTRYAPARTDRPGELGFRADRGDDAIALYQETSFGYKRLASSSCPPGSGKIDYQRVAVDSFDHP